MGILNRLLGKKPKKPALTQAQENMLQLRQLVTTVGEDPAAAQYRQELEAVEAILADTDDTISLLQDRRIAQMLRQLQEGLQDPAFDARAKMDQIKTAVDIRDVMAKTKT